jgi:hypothetical protein
MELLNPLEHLYFHASTMDLAWQTVMQHAPARQDFGGLLAELTNEHEIEFVRGLPVAHSIEDAGVLGAILWIQRQPDYLATFGNDLAYTRYAIDLVARHVSTSRLLLCEAKGSTRAWCSGGAYLRHTRRKGRQLSWRWCWASLIEFAFRGPTAGLFLTTFREFLRGEADRALLISRAHPHRAKFLVTETRAILEDEVRAIPMLEAAPERQRWLSWLQQLDSRGESSVSNGFASSNCSWPKLTERPSRRSSAASFPCSRRRGSLAHRKDCRGNDYCLRRSLVQKLNVPVLAGLSHRQAFADPAGQSKVVSEMGAAAILAA